MVAKYEMNDEVTTPSAVGTTTVEPDDAAAVPVRHLNDLISASNWVRKDLSCAVIGGMVRVISNS